MVDSEAVARARAARVAHGIHRRGIRLRRSGRELVDPCPVCGGRDRFAVHVVKNTFVCRRCPAGGGVIDLVMHLDGVPFAEAVAPMAGGAPSRYRGAARHVRGRRQSVGNEAVVRGGADRRHGRGTLPDRHALAGGARRHVAPSAALPSAVPVRAGRPASLPDCPVSRPRTARDHANGAHRRARSGITEKKGKQSNINLTLIDASMFGIV
jgi:hypothetical protein